MQSPLPEDCVELLDYMGDDLMVVNAARVSMDKRHGEFVEPDDSKLIAYLAKNGHWTPFSQPQIQLLISVPIFVARQWTRSNVGTTRNEVSRRYVDSEPTFARLGQFRYRPGASIKQGSGGDLPDGLNIDAIDIMIQVEGYCRRMYEQLLDTNVAPEQARAVLPQTMMTQWIETGSLAYWARFCGLRLDPHAQKEIRDYAAVISEIVGELFPVSWPALMGGDE